MGNRMFWKLSYSDEKHGTESPKVNASVPGCVQFDMAKAMNIPSIYCGNEIQTEMYKGLFQEVRYHWPKASMAIN